MQIVNCTQGSPEWFAARLGKPTASSFGQILQCNGIPSKQAEKYLFKLAAERIAGAAEETYRNAAMERGVLLEDEARRIYSLIKGVEVEQVGFCLDDTGSYGASPDGMVGTEGLVEIKCPLAHTHVGYLINNALPKEYFQQVQGQLLVTGRKWCDFVSYHPGMQMLIVRVKPDYPFIKAMKGTLVQFCQDLERITKQIQ